MKNKNFIFNKKKVSYVFLVPLLLALTLACSFLLQPSPATLIPPTSTPKTIPVISIDDIRLEFISATKMDSYKSASGRVFTPLDKDHLFLVVRADILSGDLEKVREMRVSIIDENGNETSPGMTTTFDTIKIVEWPIPVARSAKSFKMHFPDGQDILLDVLVGAKPDESVVPPPSAIKNADAIAGTWSGMAHNGDFSFQITVTINRSCAIGSVCGPFDIPEIPCSGTFTLTGISGSVYQFQGGDFEGSCTAGASDSLELLSDGTLLYKSTHPDYGESSGILTRQGD